MKDPIKAAAERISDFAGNLAISHDYPFPDSVEEIIREELNGVLIQAEDAAYYASSLRTALVEMPDNPLKEHLAALAKALAGQPFGNSE